jgi:outer membrane protein assembly factor BamB
VKFHLFVLMVIAVSTSSARADWRQFRGNSVNSIADGPGPASFKKLAWKIDLPGRGLSGPTVVGDKVIVTASSGYRQDKLHVLCFSAKTGKRLWERKFWATGRTQCHPKMCNATPQPVTDGKRIYAFYSSNDLACLDLDGNLVWFRGLTYDFPNASNSLGMASSPILVGDTLVVQAESDAYSFATGIDVANGKSRWRTTRPQRANWTSATILPRKSGKSLALLQSSAGVSAVEPRTGKEVWKYGDGASTIPSSTVAGGVVFVPSHGLTALRPIAGSPAPEQLWQEAKLRPGFASPLVYAGKVYTLASAGVLTTGDQKTGKGQKQQRLKGAFTSTPIAAAGLLYFFNEKGFGTILDAKTMEVVATTDLKETILCTPAISNGALYVRSDGHLWKFAR